MDGTKKDGESKNAVLRFKINGMDCVEEVAILKRELGPLVGGEDKLSFDILNAKMSIAGSDTNAESIVQAVGKTGMRAELLTENGLTSESDSENKSLFARNQREILTALSGIFLVAGFAIHATLTGSFSAALGSEGAGVGLPVPWAARGIYLLSIVCGGWLVLPKALFSIRRLRPDMNFLMVFAVSGAIYIGEWFEAATLAFLFGVSLTLEAWSVRRAKRAIGALLKLAPTIIRVKNADGTETETSPDKVAVGSTFVVRPGDKLGLDGTVLTGASAIDQAPITGESVPVSKQAGDPVYAGTINGDGLLVIQSTKVAADTSLARIVHMVQEAQSKRAPSEQWVERFAQIYMPAVMLLALAVFIAPPLFFHQGWIDWFYRALVLLVIGCPCALVISTPVSIVAALTAAAKNGILIKGGSFVEIPSQLKAIALDKTGTLTRGKPVVVEVVPLNGHTAEELLERAAAMESSSTHPIAHAVLSYTKEHNVTFQPASDFQIIQGKGATAVFNGKRFWLGSHRYLEERKQETLEVHDKLEAMSASGKTVVVIGNDEHVCGFIGIADAVRENAADVAAKLKRLGIEHVVMLTGDNYGTAAAIARQTGIVEFKAELLPEDKVAALEELLKKYGKVAMVGDGVNDAPALARATIGIAMGAIGSDAAIETADIALMSDDISKLPWLIAHSKRALSIIRQNIAFSLSVKLLFVALTFMGHASLWAAIVADMGASLLVIFNALRLLRETVAIKP